MKKSLILFTCFFLGFLLVFSESFAQRTRRGNRRAGRTNVSSQTQTAVQPAAPVAPVEVEEPLRTLSYDSIEYNSTGYNPLSTLNMHKSRIMYRMRTTRVIDFNEKCNQPFFNKGSEFTRFILDGLKSGELIGFNDSLEKQVSKKYILGELNKLMDPLDPASIVILKPEQLAQVYFTEDLVFDRQRSQTRHDIHSVRLFIPQNAFADAIPAFDRTLAVVRYKDLVNFLNSKPQATWKNPANNAEDKRFSDALHLRLFCSRITKIMLDNPTGDAIDAISAYSKGGDKSILLASQNIEYLLVSKENELYEY
jgi:gliding motility associated protien GldN